MLELGVAADAATRERCFGILRSETARLSRLFHNVIEFSQLEARKHRVAAVPGDIVPALRDAERIMARQAQLEGFQLRVEAPETLEAVVQILVNLVENSLKFGANLASRDITVFAETTAGGVRFGVRDTGPGIAGNALRRVFADFTGGAGPATLRTKETGMAWRWCAAWPRRWAGAQRPGTTGTPAALWQCCFEAERVGRATRQRPSPDAGRFRYSTSNPAAQT